MADSTWLINMTQHSVTHVEQVLITVISLSRYELQTDLTCPALSQAWSLLFWLLQVRLNPNLEVTQQWRHCNHTTIKRWRHWKLPKRHSWDVTVFSSIWQLYNANLNCHKLFSFPDKFHDCTCTCIWHETMFHAHVLRILHTWHGQHAVYVLNMDRVTFIS